MARVKMLACMAGAGFTRNVGDLVDVPDAEAVRLIEAGFAADAPPAAPESEPNGGATVKKVDEPPKPRGRQRANREAPAASEPAAIEPPTAPPAVPESETAAPPS